MNHKYLGKYDVIVVGGGTAGVPAAIAAARGGAKTLLVERTGGLGGLMATGMPALGILDRQLNKVVGGITDEIVNELKKEGMAFGDLRCPLHNSITTVSPWWWRIASSRKCAEAGVEILYSASLLDVKVENGTVVGASFLSGSWIFEAECSVMVDATGDAHAAYLAGAKYELGQPEELNDVISEQTSKEAYDPGRSKAGKVQPVSLTFCLGGVKTEEFMKYLEENPDTYKSPATYGMHYDKEYLFHSPAIYVTCFGEFIEQARANGDFDIPRDRVIFATQPNKGEYLINASRVVDIDPTDPLQMSKATDELYRQVAMLTRFFRKYCPGFSECFIANIGSFAGIRESRRIKGLRTVTKEDIDGLNIPDDSIALGGYNCDIHLSGVGLYFQPVGHAIGVPYGAMVPENVDGLLVTGRSISVDSYALAVLRVMGCCLALGEAAGTAAAIAVKDKVRVAEVDVPKLQATLVGNGAIVKL